MGVPQFSNIISLSNAEISKAIIETENQLFNLRFKKATRQSFKSHEIKHTKRGAKWWIRIFPDKTVTARAAESRMGSGKGAVDYWVAVVKPGTIIFEIGSVPEEVAKGALSLAAYKLPLKTKFIIKDKY